MAGQRNLTDYWPQIEELISRAENPQRQDLRNILEHGTPDQKRAAIFDEVGLEFEDLVFIHSKLKKIVFQGSLRFWWW